MLRFLARAWWLRVGLAVAILSAAALFGPRLLRHFAYGRVLAAQTFSTPAPSLGPDLGNTLPWVYTELWSPSSPFRKTVSIQKAIGATVLDHKYMDALWNQGIATNKTADVMPIYLAQKSDPLLRTVCTNYGGNCNAKNVEVHVPAYAVAQQAVDGHLTVIDQYAPSGPIEVDCWQTVIARSRLACSWAGVFALGGTALDAGGEGIHAGMAVTAVFLVGQEIVNGHIDHALAINAACLNDPMVFPSNTRGQTDTSCDKSRNPPHYGDLVHLLLAPEQIASSAYSAPCKTILTALALYGAYLDDTGDNGLQLHAQNELSYTANPATRSANPWPAIQAQLDAAGDGSGTHWMSCLNRLHASDFELLELRQP
jgi:hypothetical protein